MNVVREEMQAIGRPLLVAVIFLVPHIAIFLPCSFCVNRQLTGVSNPVDRTWATRLLTTRLIDAARRGHCENELFSILFAIAAVLLLKVTLACLRQPHMVVFRAVAISLTQRM